jgi:hypothetical protein
VAIVRLGWRLLAPLISLALLALAPALTRPVSADNTATQTILPPAWQADSDAAVEGGELVGGIGELVVEPAVAAGDDRVLGVLRLGVVDGRGLGHGWAVTVSASDVLVGQESVATDRLAISPVGSVAVVRGQPVAEAGPHSPAGLGGTLDEARLVIEAGPHAGNGAYRQDLRLSLLSSTVAGDLSATLTVTIAAAP